MKKQLSMVLALMLAVGSVGGMVGCGGKDDTPNTETDLEISYWDAGYGSDWLTKIAEAFEKKYPEVKVVPNFKSDNSATVSQLTSPEINTVDLYLTSVPELLAYTEYLEPLNDILNVAFEGEDKTLLAKHPTTLLRGVTAADGNIYASLYGSGACGIVYNVSVFEEKGYDVPRTTDEMVRLAASMVDDGYTPFIHNGVADYWNPSIMTWAAQYGGIEEVENFWNARYVDPETGEVEQPSIKAMTSESRQKSLEAFYEIISPKDYVYTASNQINHTEAQTLFLSGKALMTPNGNWMENEMAQTQTNVEYAFMKTPIISSLGTKLGIGDRVLAEVVSYVDSADYAAGTINDDSTEYDAARVKSVSAEVIATVAAARRIVYSEAASNKVFIPNYAIAKEWAKKFVQFMNSDEALKIFADEVKLTPVVTSTVDNIDRSKWSAFTKSVDYLMQGADYVYRMKTYKLFYSSSITEFMPYVAAKSFVAPNPADRKNATEFWNMVTTYYNDNFENAVKQAGLK